MSEMKVDAGVVIDFENSTARQGRTAMSMLRDLEKEIEAIRERLDALESNVK